MAHLHEKIDFTASVYIVHEGKVFLHKHKKLNKWLPPGGHIELDEGPMEAVLREAREESGLEVELHGITPARTWSDGSIDVALPFTINRHRINDVHEHIDFAYFGTVISGGVRAEEEGGEIGWFSKEDIEQGKVELLIRVKAFCLQALETVK